MQLRCPLTHGPVLCVGPERAVFLDRDGVLIEDTGYPDDPDRIALLPGVGAALRRLRTAGWRLVGVSNQSGVARGYFDLARLQEIHSRLGQLLAAEGAELDALYFCPHLPGAPLADFDLDCDHRKPAPGMLTTAAAQLCLDVERCWMVGDKESDVEAAHAAGCRAVRIGPGATQAEVRAESLEEAASRILERERA